MTNGCALTSQSSAFSACAFLPASSLALPYTPRRCQRLCQAPLARSRAVASLNKRIICEPLSSRTIYKAFEPRQGVVFDVALVQPERKFVRIAVQVLRADMMIDANQAALENCENAFHPICGHV